MADRTPGGSGDHLPEPPALPDRERSPKTVWESEARNDPSKRKLPRRSFWLIFAAVGFVLVLGGGILAQSIGGPSPAVSMSTPASATPTAAASSTPSPSQTPASTPAPPMTAPASDSALALLATIPVKGRAPKTGYDRVGDFGVAWTDVDHNGCDTRNDILARDLVDAVVPSRCKVTSGTLHDPYTGKTIAFVRGEVTSLAVQIDHVVALSDAWQTGAQQLSADQRLSLANDPLNLLAVDGPANGQKSDGDAATWLPPAKAYRCDYVARQVAVKHVYALWVTPAEHDAIAGILATCPEEAAPVAAEAPVVPGGGSSTDATESTPAAPAVEAPVVEPPAAGSTTIVHPGSYCSSAGETGVTAAGTPMHCVTTATDSRLRWRKVA